MISTLIVAGSIALAAAFAVAWWRAPGLRAAVEAPKHGFAVRVAQYDETCRSQQDQKRRGSDE